MEDEALPMNLEAHVAVQTVELRHIKDTTARIEQALGSHVSHAQWEQRNGYVDGEFKQVHAKIQNVEDEMKAQRAPWWVILGAGLGIVSAFVAVVGVLLK